MARTESEQHDLRDRQVQARIGTLEQLLEVYEQSVIEQSERLYAEQEAMRFQKTLLECQGEASLDGVLSVGVDGTILFANHRLAEMWRMPAPQPGRRGYDQVLQALAERTADPVRFLARSATLADDQVSREEVGLRDGRTFDQYTAPIRAREGRHFGRVWYFRDISALQEVDRVKDELVSAVSHELRTPVTSIRGSLDLLASGALGELPADAPPVLRVAQANCDRLVRLIDDILDISKLEAGRMRFQVETLELGPLLEQSVKAMAPYGERLGVAFAIEPGGAGLRVRADPHRLMQVMENLLSNAAKYSPPGETVRIAVAPRGAAVRVTVADRGPGIAPELQGRVFERFVQGPAATPRQEGGAGLGLHIAKAIIDRLGGTIGFVSGPRRGTTFHFDLPREDGEGEAR
jgi:signal transduction histidine kinase